MDLLLYFMKNGKNKIEIIPWFSHIKDKNHYIIDKMEIPQGKKLILSKEKGRVKIEIKRHKDPIMDNILVINSIGNRSYEDNWIIEKDLQSWVNNFKNKGLDQINMIDDTGSVKEDKENKK